MQAQDQDRTPEDARVAGSPAAGAGATVPGGTTVPSPAPRRLLWLWALLAGLGAGLVSWYGGERAFGAFEPVIVHPANWKQINIYERPAIDADLQRKARPVSEAKNAAVAFGLLGAMLGIGLGLAGGWARGSVWGGLAAALVGGGAGASAGAGLSMVLTAVFIGHLDPDPTASMLVPMVSRGAIWAAIGAAGGLAFGLGLGTRRAMVRALIGGLAGAVLGTLVFEAAGSAAFPLVRVESPIPGEKAQSMPRLLAHLCVAVFSALGAALGVGERGRPGDRAKPAVAPDL
jgi:hypothetical protein